MEDLSAEDIAAEDFGAEDSGATNTATEARAGVTSPVVPGYDVDRWLGRGGSATVWLATEKSTGRKVALKCFPSGGRVTGEEPGPEAEMRREVRVLSVLDHDHLVRVHAVVRLDFPSEAGSDGGGGLGLVLDYAPGGSLAVLVAGRGRLSAGETVTVLTPVAQALAYLHAHGFTHGDIAPGNVLFTAQGKPLLADLGVARMVADATTDAEHGTDGFRDPAPVDAVRAGLQPERDVYSLAALGWFCLSGRAPEPEQQRPPLPLLVPGVPAALAAALEAGLREDRRLRPTAAELATAIYRSARAEPVDLSGSVHPTVIPELITRRTLPRTGRERRVERLRRWSGDLYRMIRRTPAAVPGQETVPSRSLVGHAPPRPAAGHAPPRPPARLLPPRPRGMLAPPRSPARHAADGATAGKNAARSLGGGRPGLRVAALTVLALLTVVTGAWLLAAVRLPAPFPALSGSGPEAGAAPSPSPSPPHRGTLEPAPPAMIPQDIQILLGSEDPAEAVRGLSRLRALAFNSGDLELLDEVNVPGSPAAAADARTGARLRESGHVLTGFANVLTTVERATVSGPWRTVLAVSVAPSAYQERDASGSIVAEAGPSGEQQLRLVLVQVNGRWRIQEILPASTAPG
jgi:serine/threonine protein kinase